MNLENISFLDWDELDELVDEYLEERFEDELFSEYVQRMIELEDEGITYD